jgi:diadenylate cyclase
VDWLNGVMRRPPVDWWDIVDILVVSVLIYEILKLIRGTRAVQMALGAAMFVGLFYLSVWGHLETVNWLIRNMAVYGVFAIIVLLQTDIRRALAHFGRAPLFRYFDRGTHLDEAVEELVISVANLATRKIGALVVLERRIGLRNYIEGGIPLDAQISYDLLASIFQVSSPLHDGAVIVQGDRLAAAACFLPLSVNPKVSRELGTRHRAAIGLTEENDAAVIVISEESGVISLALDGGLERGLTPDALRVKLRALLGLRRREKPRAAAGAAGTGAGSTAA